MADDKLFELLTPTRRAAVVNIGANNIGHTELYQPLLDRDIGSLIGFEPLPEQFEILKAKHMKN
jgi:hypothetical protein